MNFLKVCSLLLKKNKDFLKDSNIGLHIQISDYVQNISRENFNKYSELYEKELKDVTSSTIIITIGPIGCGKTSISEKISNNFKDLIEHIDGDDLGLGGSKEVQKLRNERNDYTIWKIIACIMKNKIPIISCGGGIFFTYKGEFILKKRIFEILKIDVKIILLLPDNSINNFSDYDPKIHNDNFLKKIYYNNTEHIRDTVKNRINVGIWKLPNEFKSKKLLLLENIKDINYNLELDKCINNFSNKIIAHSKKITILLVI